MVKITMRNAFLSALEHLYEIAGQNNNDQPEETVVRGPEEEMLLARREEFLVDDNGLEIANEFVVGWDGIKQFHVRDGIMTLELTDGKTVQIEACP